VAVVSYCRFSRRQATRLRAERIFRGAKGDTDPLSHGFVCDMHRNCIVVVVSRYNACTLPGSNLNSTSGDPASVVQEGPASPVART
jgi:hypothetical protein